ncbi:MAG TPA: alpha-ketoacid dehydrogenase subunit beta [Bryobacteraceae bacterium]|nr:alpha-ketoacid dehydrogenase subunit beta [Bryobacteraceae bacterium]
MTTPAIESRSQEPPAEREISYVDAGIEALREEMRRDPKVFYMGQGIGPRGGNFRQARGLWSEFGDHRLRDTPISEMGTTGLGVGAAMAGFRPIVDIVFLDMVMEAMGQIVEQAATVHYSSNGKIRVPLVIRAAMGAVRSAGPHHSRCFYPWFANVPGLKVATPATAADVKGLLKTAIRDDNPVIFLEHKALYNTKGPVPAGEYTIPFGQARVCREGADVTIAAVSLMVWKALQAAELLAPHVSAEVIDLRTVAPLDRETLLASVRKTGRLVLVEEGPATCSFVSEISALVSEEAFDYLDAPIHRVCALPVPHPFHPALEAEMLPSPAKIAAAVRQLLG